MRQAELSIGKGKTVYLGELGFCRLVSGHGNVRRKKKKKSREIRKYVNQQNCTNEMSSSTPCKKE